MAQVTFNNTPNRHIIGDMVVRFFNVSGASGSTLPTGLSQILYVNAQRFTTAGTASLITGLVAAQGTLTFTSSAPMVNEVVEVIGREG